MKNLFILIFILFLSSQSVFCEDRPQTPFEITKEIKDKLTLIKELSVEEYPQKIDSFRRSMEKYIDHKKKVCSGEFSILILEEGKQPEPTETKTLSKKEHQLCFHELKALQITYVNNMFIAREKYLISIHEKQVEELKKTREEIIKRLQSQYN